MNILGRPAIIPFSEEETAQKGHGFYYNNREFIHHSALNASDTAFHRVSTNQLLLILLLLFILTDAFLFNWHATLVALVAVITVLYFADLLFNFFLIYRSFAKPAELFITEEEIAAFPENNWPKYTVLCPLYKEPEVVPQFIQAMSELEYPKNKLQVMLLLEEDDEKTIEAIKKMVLPTFFDIVVVPHSLPKTKPKACNYGLTKARGEYVVIYDAEDVPDILQLKKAVLAFNRVERNVVCIQAKLNFYNPHQNLLTRIFTAEYSLWFDLVLTGLQSIKAPIPLGGTSNHFRMSDLQDLKGWDSFNVTEDADLGMRLVKKGFYTAIVDSETKEEANSEFKNWFNQRTRWIKGYMQTYLLHMRRPSEFLRQWNEPHVITFQLVIGGKVLSMLINPFMWITTACYFLFRAHIGLFIESFFPPAVLYMGVFSLFFGNFLYMYYYMIGCAKHGHYELVKYVFFVPLYWLMMSISAWFAVYDLLWRPHHWAKTKHGLHLKKEGAVIVGPFNLLHIEPDKKVDTTRVVQERRALEIPWDDKQDVAGAMREMALAATIVLTDVALLVGKYSLGELRGVKKIAPEEGEDKFNGQTMYIDFLLRQYESLVKGVRSHLTTYDEKIRLHIQEMRQRGRGQGAMVTVPDR